MEKNKLIGFMLVAFVLGVIIGGAYVNSYGLNMPLRDAGQKSSAMVQGGGGESTKVGHSCSYTNSNGVIRRGVVAEWEDFGFVCQSSSGWSANYR